MENKYMKSTIGVLISLIIGGVIGFFGVFLSVFSDGDMGERAATIGVIILIYLVLGAVSGLVWPDLKWIVGLMIGLPGAILLLFYMFKEFNVLYIPYLAAVLILPSLVSNLTSKARRKPK